MFSLGLWPMYLFMYFYSTLHVFFRFQLSFGIVVCLGFVGVVLRTPGLRDYTILCVAFPLIAFIN